MTPIAASRTRSEIPAEVFAQLPARIPAEIHVVLMNADAAGRLGRRHLRTAAQGPDRSRRKRGARGRDPLGSLDPVSRRRLALASGSALVRGSGEKAGAGAGLAGSASNAFAAKIMAESRIASACLRWPSRISDATAPPASGADGRASRAAVSPGVSVGIGRSPSPAKASSGDSMRAAAATKAARSAAGWTESWAPSPARGIGSSSG